MSPLKALLGVLGVLSLGAAIASAAILKIEPTERAMAAGPPGPARLAAGPASFAGIVGRVRPAVVSVTAYGAPTPGAAAPARAAPRAMGSGFFISPDGYAVTNNHVVEGADRVRLTLSDRRVLEARVVGRDPATDLALLKAAAKDLPFVSFAAVGDPSVGDWVIAVGSPFGLGGTATAGIVSAVDREIGQPWVRFLQIDASINRGNSGGPAFDTQGRVVGVNTAILGPEGGSVGIGFAVPARLAVRVVEALRKDGRVARGYLGATVADLDADLALDAGLPAAGPLVLDVVTAGPAARAGLRAGDVVMALNGRDIESPADMMRRVAAAGPGGALRLQVARGGERIVLRARAGERSG